MAPPNQQARLLSFRPKPSAGSGRSTIIRQHPLQASRIAKSNIARSSIPAPSDPDDENRSDENGSEVGAETGAVDQAADKSEVSDDSAFPTENANGAFVEFSDSYHNDTPLEGSKRSREEKLASQPEEQDLGSGEEWNTEDEDQARQSDDPPSSQSTVATKGAQGLDLYPNVYIPPSLSFGRHQTTDKVRVDLTVFVRQRLTASDLVEPLTIDARIAPNLMKLLLAIKLWRPGSWFRNIRPVLWKFCVDDSCLSHGSDPFDIESTGGDGLARAYLTFWDRCERVMEVWNRINEMLHKCNGLQVDDNVIEGKIYIFFD